MEEPRYVRHKPSGRKYVWHPLYAQDDYEPWEDRPQDVIIDVEATVIPDTVVSISSKAQKPKKAGLFPPSGGEALAMDASRGLP